MYVAILSLIDCFVVTKQRYHFNPLHPHEETHSRRPRAGRRHSRSRSIPRRKRSHSASEASIRKGLSPPPPAKKTRGLQALQLATKSLFRRNRKREENFSARKLAGVQSKSPAGYVTKLAPPGAGFPAVGGENASPNKRPTPKKKNPRGRWARRPKGKRNCRAKARMHHHSRAGVSGRAPQRTHVSHSSSASGALLINNQWPVLSTIQ